MPCGLPYQTQNALHPEWVAASCPPASAHDSSSHLRQGSRHKCQPVLKEHIDPERAARAIRTAFLSTGSPTISSQQQLSSSARTSSTRTAHFQEPVAESSMAPPSSLASSSADESVSNSQAPFSVARSDVTAASLPDVASNTVGAPPRRGSLSGDTTHLVSGMDTMSPNIPSPQDQSTDSVLALGETVDCSSCSQECQNRRQDHVVCPSLEPGMSAGSPHWVSVDRVCRSCTTMNVSQRAVEGWENRFAQGHSREPDQHAPTGTGGDTLGQGYGLMSPKGGGGARRAVRSETSTRATTGDSETDMSFSSRRPATSR